MRDTHWKHADYLEIEQANDTIEHSGIITVSLVCIKNMHDDYPIDHNNHNAYYCYYYYYMTRKHRHDAWVRCIRPFLSLLRCAGAVSRVFGHNSCDSVLSHHSTRNYVVGKATNVKKSTRMLPVEHALLPGC